MENTRCRILLVEDDKLDQMAFKRLVEDRELPYDCTIAGSVSEAQSILGSEQFDIVIADYSLGDGTAFDILGLVKDTPTILVTGAGDEEIAVKAWKAGAYDYLIKDHERNYLKAVPITVENAIEHKKTEAKLQLLSGAVMSTDDSVYIADMENKIIFVNKAFCETYGYKKEEIIGKDSNILWMGKHQGENTRSVFRIAGSTSELGFYHKRKDDSIFPVSLSKSIIRDSSGNEVAVVGVARDISDRILVEDELRTTNQKLRERTRLKSELAIMVCHQLMTLADEFKNIVYSDMAGALGEIGSKLRDNLKLAGERIDRVRRIISDFLDISEIDTAKVKLEPTQFSLRSVVSQVIEALSPLADEKDIELASFVPDSELIINADRQRIVQVLNNLIGNAINLTPASGHISVRVRDVDNEITVEVQDSAQAIKSNRIKKIFNPFAQIDEQLRSGKEAPVLGLPIAKELVEMHGGQMWGENRGGRGNSFCFALPKSGIREEVSVVVKAGTADYGDRTR